MIKVFSSFFFANHDTKTPFYISVISVFLNIIISVFYFNKVGFIIIPLATTISSWFNSIILFIFLRKKNFFRFNDVFLKRFLRITCASILMGVFFKFQIIFFQNQLNYDYHLKLVYLIICVLLCISFYLLLSLFIKAFKTEDIKLKY